MSDEIEVRVLVKRPTAAQVEGLVRLYRGELSGLSDDDFDELAAEGLLVPARPWDGIVAPYVSVLGVALLVALYPPPSARAVLAASEGDA